MGQPVEVSRPGGHTEMCNKGDHYFCNAPNCVCACHPAPRLVWHDDVRAAYIKGAKDERERAWDASDVGAKTYCRRCRIGTAYLHASGLCKMCEVESRVE